MWLCSFVVSQDIHCAVFVNSWEDKSTKHPILYRFTYLEHSKVRSGGAPLRVGRTGARCICGGGGGAWAAGGRPVQRAEEWGWA